MATRVLPGVYVSLNDMSQLPEGATSLTVGYPLAAKRGPIGEVFQVTSPSSFLKKCTFTGKPSLTDDPTFHSVLKVLARTNRMFLVRAANKPLYGGAIVLKGEPADYGTIASAKAEDKTITLTGTSKPSVGDRVVLSGAGAINGVYTVVSISGKTLTVAEKIAKDFTAGEENKTKLVKSPIQPLPDQEIGDITAVEASAEETKGSFKIAGDVSGKFAVGGSFRVAGCSVASNNKVYSIASVEVAGSTNLVTEITVNEEVAAVTGESVELGTAFAFGLEDPKSIALGENELFFIAGKDPGAYNGDIAFTIVSSKDNAGALPYDNTMTLNVYDPAYPTSPLESFTFSFDETARAIDGTSLYFENVIAGSSYIQIINKEGNLDLPYSTSEVPVRGGNGSDGGLVTAETFAAALDLFADKTIPISVLGSDCSAVAEEGAEILQSKMLEIADLRKDIMVFLNAPKETERAANLDDRAQTIVDYKKGTLASTSFFGCMYAPHVKTSDVFNQRQVEIGADSIAIAGWLDVISNLGYPYAYAGPRNGLITGCTCDWKIGDTSGQAELLNDASINYVAYDGKVGRYYMQTQNTLQIANSTMRNIGSVLNVLNIKETLAVLLKEYINLPITGLLRADILNTCNDYLAPMQGVRFYNYTFQDVSSDTDIADNTLRYLLTFSPTAYASKIYLVMNIVNASFDFAILQSA